MNGHAYEHYLDVPTTLFKGWNGGQVQGALASEVESARRGRRALEARTLTRISWYPSFASGLIAQGMLTEHEVESVLAKPEVRFRALCNDYTAMADRLEPGLLNDEESVERLIRWLRFKGKTPRMSETSYLKLLKDPNRLYRLTPPAARPEREKLSEMSSSRARESAPWAFLYVSCHAISRLDPEIISALSTSEEYSYLAAFVLRRRGLPASVWQELLLNIQSLRWAYHVMVDLEMGSKMDTGLRVRFLNLIHTSPPWAVQMWEARRWRGEQLEWAFAECADHSAGHECIPELNSWYRMTRAMEGTPAAAVA